MQLINFPYTTTKGIAEYSKMVTEIIDLLGIIHDDPGSSIPWGEDRLEYWDKSSDNICFGRYLLFKNPKNERIQFWMGLHSTSWSTNLIVWFKKAEPFTKYAQKLRDTFNPAGQYAESPGEVWISMKDGDFKAFCETSSLYQQRKDSIKNFLSSVLGVLN
jgi:hypothetical protein